MMPITLDGIFSVPDQPHHPTSQSGLLYRSFGQSEKATRVDVARFHGSRNGIGCIIRQVLIVCFVLKRRWKYQWVTAWEPSFMISDFSNWKDTSLTNKNYEKHIK